MDTLSLIRVLKEVPECRLRLIELTWKVVREDGSVDPEKLLFHRKELEECIAEAQAYTKATKEATQCLRNMARS